MLPHRQCIVCNLNRDHMVVMFVCFTCCPFPLSQFYSLQKMSSINDISVSLAESTEAKRERSFKEGTQKKEHVMHLKQQRTGSKIEQKKNQRQSYTCRCTTQTTEQRQPLLQVRRERLDDMYGEQSKTRLQQVREQMRPKGCRVRATEINLATAGGGADERPKGC